MATKKTTIAKKRATIKKTTVAPPKLVADNNQLAVIQLGSHQYMIHPGETIKVQKVHILPGEKFIHSQVLLYHDSQNTIVGTPFLENVSVELQLEKDFKDDKVRVARFRAKSRHRRVRGHRQTLSLLKVVLIKKS